MENPLAAVMEVLAGAGSAHADTRLAASKQLLAYLTEPGFASILVVCIYDAQFDRKTPWGAKESTFVFLSTEVRGMIQADKYLWQCTTIQYR